MKTCKYFSPGEFKRCSPSCSIDQMDQNFLTMLDALRAQAGIPLVLTSAYRSPAWDRSKGRSGTGAHTKGLAADIKVNASGTRLKIVKAALELGIRRIGVAGSFVHVDIDKSLPEGIWTY